MSSQYSGFTLKMEVACSSDTSLDFQQTTRRYIPRKYNFLITTAVINSNSRSRYLSAQFRNTLRYSVKSVTILSDYRRPYRRKQWTTLQVHVCLLVLISNSQTVLSTSVQEVTSRASSHHIRTSQAILRCIIVSLHFRHNIRHHKTQICKTCLFYYLLPLASPDIILTYENLQLQS
jgi:phage-related holin